MTAAAALLLAILIWASNSIMIKVVLREIDPLTPILAAVLAWIFFGEAITTALQVCGAVIAAGVYLVNRA